MALPDRNPTTTVTPSRVRLFQASQRPIQTKGEWLETQYGFVRVTGRLGQRHADLLESILYHAECLEPVNAGGTTLIDCEVDPALLRRTIGKQYSQQQILMLMDELIAAAVEIRTNEFEVQGRLIDLFLRQNAPESQMHGALKHKVRTRWRVRFGALLVQLIRDDIRRYYDPAPIARLETGIAQAAARWILTHKNSPIGGWKLDTVIVAVCGAISTSAMRDKRRDLRKDTNGLLSCGIHFQNDRFLLARESSPPRPVAASHLAGSG